MRKLTTFLVILVFAGLQVAFAQRTVTGTVTRAADKTPLPGVTVLLQGSTVGTLTDGNGKYSISVPNEKAVLQFSFIGFGEQTVTIGNQSVVNVELAETLLEMDEVVVTALGIKREAKSLGYSVSTVNTAQIQESNSVNVGNSLLGKVAGLNVSAPPTGPGGSSKIRIRGQSSFGGDNSPLIVVNGIPINNASTSTGIGGDMGDGLQSINPEDIESMSVLKGASAAALYGYRAKDGVIIITTKNGSGKKGLGIDFTSSFVADQALDFTDLQYVYGQGENGHKPASIADARSSSSWSFGEKMDGSMVYAYDGIEHPYSPFKDRFAFYDTGLTFNNTLAFSGGTEMGSFHVSLGNNDAKAITPGSSFNKKIIDVGINYKIGEKLTLSTNANYSVENNTNPPGSTQGHGIANSVLTTAVSNDIRWLENAYKDPVTGNEIQHSRLADRTNPYWTINERFESRKRNRLFGNILLRYDVLPWLYVQGRIGQDYFNAVSENNNPTGTAYLKAPAQGYNGSYSQSTSQFREINTDFMIGANKDFGKFDVNATFGGNAMNQENMGLNTSVTDFYVRGQYTIQNGITKTPTQSYSHKKVNSLYGTMDLSYNDYLFVNFTGRNDWFSTLNPESNSYLYPSVSTSFLFSQAFKNIMPDWLTYGKVRASYAEVGGDTSPYGGDLYYSLQTNPFDGTYAYGGYSSGINPNANLKPLKIRETEVGMELILFDRRISIDVAGYIKHTDDEILNVDISAASGFNQTKVNIGRLKNQGIESLLTLVPVRFNDFQWETAFNYTYNISEVLELAEGQKRLDVSDGQMWMGQVSHEVGKPLGSLRGTDYLRDDQGRIITTNGRFSADPVQVTYGSVVPKHIGGWLNTLTYKKFKLFAQVDFKAGHKLISQTNYNFVREGMHKMTLDGREGGIVFNGVNADGTPNTTAVEVQTFFTDYSGKKVYTPFIYDASFIKLRQISASADLTKYVRNTFIKGLTLNASVNNVAVFLKYIDNLDPECISNVSDNNAGIEQMGPPTTRSYGLTVNIKF